MSLCTSFSLLTKAGLPINLNRISWKPFRQFIFNFIRQSDECLPINLNRISWKHSFEFQTIQYDLTLVFTD